MSHHIIIIILSLIVAIFAQHDPHFWVGRIGIVHLFEWKWTDIANECEQFLAPNGFGGVQVSPVNENAVVKGRPWWERYQPMSYILTTRSGNEAEFRNMVKRCNDVGVRIYVDAVFNHMAASENPMPLVGTAGSQADPAAGDFPAVPYRSNDFHLPRCTISDYQNRTQVRDCELGVLRDLDQKLKWVRDRIVEFLDHLIEIGVAGYRVDAAKHMWPEHLQVIYNRVRNLNTAHGYPENSRPFIYQEVIDLGEEPITKFEYNHMGVVTEFKFSAEIGRAFKGDNELKMLEDWGPKFGFLPSKDALVFVDNHDNQRGHGAGGENILTYKDARKYKMATAFKLAHPFGHVRIMSSFSFIDTSIGPPQDDEGNIISPSFNADGTCGNGWVCEHRWREIYQMINFRNVVHGTEINHWWDNGNNQIAFCRGDRGFAVWNGEDTSLSEVLQTCLPAGKYCDIISGKNVNGRCTGNSITVDASGKARISINETSLDGVQAYHVGSASNI